MTRATGDDLDIATWDALKGAAWPIFVGIAARTRQAGLTSAQSSLLFVLLQSKGTLTPLQISRVLKVTPGTVTGTLNPLEEVGLIKRTRGKAPDRRVVQLQLTAKGRRVMERWLGECRKVIVARMSGLTSGEKRTVIDLLAKVAPAQPGVPEGLASVMKLEPVGRTGARDDDP